MGRVVAGAMRSKARRHTIGSMTDEILDELFEVIEQRKADLPEDSYTASLFTHEKGENAVLEKLGEESTELILAAKDDDREELAHESADIVYHLYRAARDERHGPRGPSCGVA